MATVKATKKGEERVVSVEWDLPESLQGLIDKFGEDVVANAAASQLTIGLQAFIRRHFEKTDEEIQQLVNEYVPGVRGPVVKKSPLEKATAALASMSPEERAQLLAKLQAAG